MPESKHALWFATLRPRCGLQPSEIDSIRTWCANRSNRHYLAIETAGLSPQATHAHLLMEFPRGIRKSNLKAMFLRDFFKDRVVSSVQAGLDIRHCTDVSFRFRLGYCQKEAHELCSYSGFSDDELKSSFCLYLEQAKKALRGKPLGCIPLRDSNLFAFIRDERIRSGCPCPLENFQRLIQSDHYTIPFASKKQQIYLERCLASSTTVDISWVKHILGACQTECPNCRTSPKFEGSPSS